MPDFCADSDSEGAPCGPADELVENGEALVEGGILLQVSLDDAMHALLDHDVDQVLLVALEEDREEEQARGFAVGHRARLLDQVHLVADEEVAARVHQELGVDLRRVALQHQRRVQQRD